MTLSEARRAATCCMDENPAKFVLRSIRGDKEYPICYEHRLMLRARKVPHGFRLEATSAE